jgi:hypothetical protein
LIPYHSCARFRQCACILMIRPAILCCTVYQKDMSFA